MLVLVSLKSKRCANFLDGLVERVVDLMPVTLETTSNEGMRESHLASPEAVPMSMISTPGGGVKVKQRPVELPRLRSG